MACPFFYPVAVAEELAFIVAPRLPLGAAFHGECRAQPDPYSPEQPLLTQACNTGYSGTACERFPAVARADAVRFHITGAQQDPLQIQFVFEKNCWPAGHGTLEYSKAQRRFLLAHEDPVIQRQAEVFVERFLRRSQLNVT